MGDFVLQEGKLTEYHGNDSVIFIPDGTESFEWKVFGNSFSLDSSISEIHIPDSVKIINGCVFADKQTIYLPRYLESLDQTYLPEHLFIYDSCKINMVENFLDFHLQGNSGRGSRIIDVLSSDTGRILYSVFWDEGFSCWHGAYRQMINSAWKNLGNFDFKIYDDFFKELKMPALKEKHALFRLKFPYDLSIDNKKTYISYLKRNAQTLLHKFIKSKDIDSLRFVAELGLLDKKENLEDAILFAQNVAPELAASVFLIKWKKEHSAPDVQPTKERPIIGSIIEMGIDPDTNGPLQWVVIDQTKDKNLLLSVEILCNMPYFCKTKLGKTEYKTVTWEDSFLRKWLNETFLNTHFSASEKELVEPISRKTKSSGTINDYAAILSEKEFLKYVNVPIIKKLKKEGKPEFLRDVISGGKSVTEIQINKEGTDYSRFATPSFAAESGVRPAIWIKR